MKKLILSSMLTAIITISANAEDHSHHHHHGHHNHNEAIKAPIGVMGSHLHPEGELMVSYRFSRMVMKGNRDNTSDLTAAQVIADPRFMISPLDMDMEMHMFGAMYGLTNDITLMGMLPYTRKVMGHVNMGGAHFTTETEGIGDVKLSGLIKYDDNIHFNVGVSTPTGATNEYDTTPLGHIKLPYPMQLGSGTFDPMLGVTFQDNMSDIHFGAQANTTLRLYDNSDDYHLGNEYNITTWIAKPLNDWLTGSLRLEAKAWEDVSGADSQLNLIIPTARTNLRGGQRIDALVGFDIAPEFVSAPLRAEFGVPVYQNLEGPQMKTNYRLVFGTEYSF